MTRAILLTLCVSLPLGCVRTSLDTGENHPANPKAAASPIPQTPPTLRSGFDPNADEPGEKSSEGPDHQHHHHHHDPGPGDHSHHGHHDRAPGPSDGGEQ